MGTFHSGGGLFIKQIELRKMTFLCHFPPIKHQPILLSFSLVFYPLTKCSIGLGIQRGGKCNSDWLLRKSQAFLLMSKHTCPAH